MVTLKIDGQTVTVPKGTNVLEAAKQAGVHIPYFCYHPGLSSPAVCRQCLVDVKGQPKLVPSCYTPVADNMEVNCSSEKVEIARRQMLEFTLVNHPVDCPICDKAGECTLQKHYVDWDSKFSRVDLYKVRKKKVVDIGPRIVLDQERCILCTRCIRVCDEVAGEHQLDMANRGDREVLTTAPGTELDNAYSLNTVDVCPVGALTSKDFRFAMRAWELKQVPSVCTGCATGCNTEIHFASGRLYRLMPRENKDVNRYWMCDEGRLTYKEVHERRVVKSRVDGKVVLLPEAIRQVATKLRALLDADRGRVGIVFSAQHSNEDNFALRRLGDVLGLGKRYLFARPPRPERADKILRVADVNPNLAGATRALLEGATAESMGVSASGPAGVDMGALAKALANRELSGLIILGGEINCDDDKLTSLLGDLPLVVSLACQETAVAMQSHAVLPMAAWAEVHATMTNATGRVQQLHPAIEPPGAGRPGWQLLGMIASELGHGPVAASAKAVFGQMVAEIMAFSGAHWQEQVLPRQLRFAESRG